MIAAVTFDFWDTLVVDDSDEPLRAARGLLSKPEARVAAFVGAVMADHPRLEAAQVSAALDRANAWFQRLWKQEHRTPTVAQRLDVGLEGLGIGRPSGFDAAVAEWEQLELDPSPQLTEGAAEMLAAVSERWAVGIISDTIVSPGRCLRQLLEGYGLSQYFHQDALIFSDEIGAAKPDPRVFARAAAAFGQPPSSLVHVGDRAPNDVAGPLAAGWSAVLYTGAVDRGGAGASAVCTHHRDLPGIIERL